MSVDKPDNDYQIVNGYDEVVRQTVRDVMAREDMCHCEKCFLDVCSLVFNSGFSHYVTTQQGALFTKMSDMNVGNHVDLFLAVLQAVEVVKARPSHQTEV